MKMWAALPVLVASSPPVIISLEHKKYTRCPPDKFANAFNNGQTHPADRELIICLISHFFCCLYFLIYDDCQEEEKGFPVKCEFMLIMVIPPQHGWSD